MVKHKRSFDEVDAYESDGGFVSNDDGNAPKTKKTKKDKMGGKKGKDGADNQFWTLSAGRQPRRVEISEFKGTKLISIREFYEKNDQYLPGKKGISLTIDQYKALLNVIPDINAGLKKAGIDVEESALSDDDEFEEETKPRRNIKVSKKEKSNIEETSDEDDE